MSHSKLTESEVITLAKGLYSMNKAMQYYEALMASPNIATHAKYFLASIQNKLSWCVREAGMRVDPENRSVFDAEISRGDTIQFDAVFDEMVNMTPEQRNILELVAAAIRKGEVKFVEEEAV